jgi:hypothetical protein
MSPFPHFSSMTFSKFCTRAAAVSMTSVLLVSGAIAATGNTTKTKPVVDTACMATAIDARDTAIVTALGAYTTALTTDFQTRSTALKAAWTLTDAKARNAALKAAWKAFNTSSKADRKTYNTARKAAWTSFSAGAKTCKGSSSSDDTSGAKAEASL